MSTVDIERLGRTKADWNVRPLKTLGRFYGGLTGKSGDDFKVEENDTFALFVPFTNIFNNNIIRPDVLAKVKVQPGEKQNQVNKGDILFLMSSEDYDGLGKPALVDDQVTPLYLNSFCKGLRLTEGIINPHYLNYYLIAEPIRDFVRIKGEGYTRINLKTGNLGVCPVLIPSPSEQSRIAAFLDERCAKIDEAVARHKTLIEKLDEYRKAVITEAIKSCDSDLMKLKFCVKLSTEKADSKDNYIALENIESQTGRYVGSKLLPEGEAIVTKRGYVLFGKLRPYLAKCYVVEQDGCCSGEFLVMNCQKVSARFLQYVLLEQTLVDKINMSTYGTKMPRANWGFISNQFIPVPSSKKQSEIVAFLDKKCSAIDSAKERHQQLIYKLEEYKKSLIYNAVTGKIEC